MANLGRKEGVYHIRFRFLGRQFKRSLKTRDQGAAAAAGHLIELTLHRLLTGQIRVPEDVDPADFIVSGGTLLHPPKPHIPQPKAPSLRQLASDYAESVRGLLAPTYLYSQQIHLRHLLRHLGPLADDPCDRIGFRDLDGFLKARLAIRHPNTAERERITLLPFFKWLVAQD